MQPHAAVNASGAGVTLAGSFRWEEVVVVDSQQPYWYQRTTSSRNRGELVSAPENPPTVTCATNRTEQAD
eukprot:COSAG06_NODE_28088_length_581_cov_0.636929_1_plen_70_part_00